MYLSCGDAGFPCHLPGIVDAVARAEIPPRKGAEIGHARAIGAGDEGMVLSCDRQAAACHLSGIVDTVGEAIVETKRAEVGHVRTIDAGDKGAILSCDRVG